MPDFVSLPFCVPTFSTTPGFAAPEIAMQGHPTAYNSCLNQLTTPFCNRRFLFGFTSPQVGMRRSGIHCFDCLEKYSVSSRFGYPHYRDIIKRMLDEGFYIFFTGIDDFYIPEKCWYGIRHMSHDGIICGYDDRDDTYSIAAYDMNWLFRLIRIPQNSFIEGLYACIKNKQFGELTAFKMKENTVVNLDEKLILRYLKEYVEKTADKFPLNQPWDVEGIAVQDFLIMYLEKIEEGSIPSDKMDWRALRPIWEHKRCMLDRIKAIEKKRGWNDELSTQYAPLVEDANRVRMMYAMYHKTQKQSLLDKMKAGILVVRNKEEEILKEFIKRMEEKK